MKFQHLFVTAITAVFVTGCATVPPAKLSVPNADQQALFKHVVLGSLKDPDSAKFGEMVLVDDGKGACVEVNAKNGFGGYTGYQQAILMNYERINLGWRVKDFKNITREECIDELH